MECRHYFFIFLIALIAFSPIFFREMPYGWDAPYFLQASCDKKPLESEGIATNIAFLLLPCNIFVAKCLFFLCCLVSALFAGKLGSLYNKKGWLAGAFVFATPIWVTEFWKIENDGLAYPLIFAGAYFFYKGLKNKNTKDKVFGIGLVLIAFLFWQGAIIWVIAFFLSWKWSWIASIPMLFLTAIKYRQYNSYFIGRIMPRFGTATEYLPAYGFLYQGFLLTGLIFISRLPIMIAPTAFFITMAFINSKFAIQATFPLAIAATLQFENAKTVLMKWLPVLGTIIVICFTTSMCFSLPPSPQELMAAELAVAEAKGKTICNDWSTGHLIEYLGGKALAKGGGEQLCQGCKDCVMLTYRNFNCIQLNETKNDRELKVYKC